MPVASATDEGVQAWLTPRDRHHLRLPWVETHGSFNPVNYFLLSQRSLSCRQLLPSARFSSNVYESSGERRPYAHAYETVSLNCFIRVCAFPKQEGHLSRLRSTAQVPAFWPWEMLTSCSRSSSELFINSAPTDPQAARVRFRSNLETSNLWDFFTNAQLILRSLRMTATRAAVRATPRPKSRA